MDAGSAAAAASGRKSANYSNLSSSHLLYPVAVETLSVLADEAHEFITEISRRASQCTADRRETTFLYQRISMEIQCFNAVCLCNTFSVFESPIHSSHSRHYTLSLISYTLGTKYQGLKIIILIIIFIIISILNY